MNYVYVVISQRSEGEGVKLLVYGPMMSIKRVLTDYEMTSKDEASAAMNPRDIKFMTVADKIPEKFWHLNLFSYGGVPESDGNSWLAIMCVTRNHCMRASTSRLWCP
jgi:hypothetical protein